jgi:hypothetical protein
MSPRLDTPDMRIREVWTSATEHHAVFRDPADARRYSAANNAVTRLYESFPHRRHSAELARRLNQASRWYPRQALWLLVGLIAVAFRRPRGFGGPLLVAAAALLIIVFTALGVYAVSEYALPVAPAFVLLAAVGLLGGRTARPAREAQSLVGFVHP